MDELAFPKPQKQVKKPKRIKQIGKVGLEWTKVRARWLELNPPDYRGTWLCGLCGNPVTYAAMDLDHIKGRGSHPDLRFELSNLRPVHRTCHIRHTAKGGI